MFIYDIRRESSERFANIVKEKFSQLEVIVTEDIEKAAKQSDIIDCVTLASEPFIKGEWLKKGALVMNMADYEVDNECVKKADKIVVDFWEGIKHRMISTVALMWKDGLVKDSDIHAELGEILCDKKPGRENDDEIIYFNAVGAGILDIAVVSRCYTPHFSQAFCKR